MSKTRFWTPLFLLIILTGCRPPCDGPNCPLPQQTTVDQAILDKIEENGKAADGKDFIAAPPVGWVDPTEAAVINSAVVKRMREIESETIAETTK